MQNYGWTPFLTDNLKSSGEREGRVFHMTPMGDIFVSEETPSATMHHKEIH